MTAIKTNLWVGVAEREASISQFVIPGDRARRSPRSICAELDRHSRNSPGTNIRADSQENHAFAGNIPVTGDAMLQGVAPAKEHGGSKRFRRPSRLQPSAKFPALVPGRC
jgi:hypothetical protein